MNFKGHTKIPPTVSISKSSASLKSHLDHHTPPRDGVEGRALSPVVIERSHGACPTIRRLRIRANGIISECKAPRTTRALSKSEVTAAVQGASLSPPDIAGCRICRRDARRSQGTSPLYVPRTRLGCPARRHDAALKNVEKHFGSISPARLRLALRVDRQQSERGSCFASRARRVLSKRHSMRRRSSTTRSSLYARDAVRTARRPHICRGAARPPASERAPVSRGLQGADVDVAGQLMPPQHLSLQHRPPSRSQTLPPRRGVLHEIERCASRDYARRVEEGHTQLRARFVYDGDSSPTCAQTVFDISSLGGVPLSALASGPVTFGTGGLGGEVLTRPTDHRLFRASNLFSIPGALTESAPIWPP